jgi:hypothetical protein
MPGQAGHDEKDIVYRICYHYFVYLCKKDTMMDTPASRPKKVQAILRMSPETYEAIRRAAGRNHKSFNSYAVETLEAAAIPKPEPKIKISELTPDSEWERFIVHSLDLTEEEIGNDPRLSAILGL